MPSLFEYTDTLNSPYEVFLFDTTREGFPVRPHWHYFMEVIYMMEGRCRAECDGESYLLEQGDLILFYPEAVHAMYSADGLPLSYGVMKFDVNRLNTGNSYVPKLRAVLNRAARDEHAPVCFPAGTLEGVEVGAIFEECRRELAVKDYGYDILVHDRLCSLMVALIRAWRRLGFDSMAVAEDTKAVSLRSITGYIDEHSGEALRVEELAEMCSMSYSYFAKSFKRLYGRSCKEYIEFIRICKAEDLLLFTDYDLNFISQETGFSDSSHLIKSFRRWKGMTPGQYKRRQAIHIHPTVQDSDREKNLSNDTTPPES